MSKLKRVLAKVADQAGASGSSWSGRTNVIQSGNGVGPGGAPVGNLPGGFSPKTNTNTSWSGPSRGTPTDTNSFNFGSSGGPAGVRFSSPYAPAPVKSMSNDLMPSKPNWYAGGFSGGYGGDNGATQYRPAAPKWQAPAGYSQFKNQGQVDAWDRAKADAVARYGNSSAIMGPAMRALLWGTPDDYQAAIGGAYDRTARNSDGSAKQSVLQTGLGNSTSGMNYRQNAVAANYKTDFDAFRKANPKADAATAANAVDAAKTKQKEQQAAPNSYAARQQASRDRHAAWLANRNIPATPFSKKHTWDPSTGNWYENTSERAQYLNKPSSQRQSEWADVYGIGGTLQEKGREKYFRDAARTNYKPSAELQSMRFDSDRAAELSSKLKQLPNSSVYEWMMGRPFSNSTDREIYNRHKEEMAARNNRIWDAAGNPVTEPGQDWRHLLTPSGR